MLAARRISSTAGFPAELAYLTTTDQPFPNNPPASVWTDLRRLHATIQAFTRHAGPIHVTSGYRSAEVNRAAGGVPNSLHLVGRAADLIVGPPLGTRGFFDKLRSDPSILAGVIQELILYERNGEVTHLHVAIPVAGLEPAPTIQIKRRSGGQTIGGC